MHSSVGSELAQGIPNVNVAGVEMGGREALTAGWEALRDVMRSMGIQSREQLAEWIHNPNAQVGRLHQWKSAGADLEHRDRTRRQGVGDRVCVCDGDDGSVRAQTRTSPTHSTGSQTEHQQRLPGELLGGIGRHQFPRGVREPIGCPHSVRGWFRQAVRCQSSGCSWRSPRLEAFLFVACVVAPEDPQGRVGFRTRITARS